MKVLFFDHHFRQDLRALSFKVPPGVEVAKIDMGVLGSPATEIFPIEVANGTIGHGYYAEKYAPQRELWRKVLTEVFSHTLMNALKELGHLHDSVIEQIMSWQHCGFSAWTGEQISPTDNSARQFIARYIDRGPVANSKIQITDDIITYLTDSALTHEFSATEFLARITPHIPNKWEQTVRYYGYYSARTRGKRRLVQPQSLSVIPELDKRKASKTWVALIKKIYEVDPLICPKCQEFMKIVAFITNHKELEKIISNLNIQPYKTPPPITSPPTIDSSYSPFFDDLQTVAD